MYSLYTTFKSFNFIFSTLPLFKKVVQNIWLHLTTFQKSSAKYLAPPYYFSKKLCKRFGSTLLLFKKVVQKIWLHLTTFQKSSAKDLAPPYHFSKK